MPVRINLKELFGSDSQINTVDKLNFNFNKLLSLGIGLEGAPGITGGTGSIGPSGLQGLQGDKGNQWFVGSSDPNSQTFVDLMDEDFYMNTDDSQIWQYDEVTDTWTLLIDLGGIVNNYLASSGSTFVRGFGDGSPQDSRYIMFPNRGNNSIDQLADDGTGASTSNNDIFLLNNFNETVQATVLDISDDMSLTDSYYTAIQKIYVDRTNPINRRYHLEFGSLNDESGTGAPFKLSELKQNLKIRHEYDGQIFKGVFSLTKRETDAPADIDYNGAFDFQFTKFEPSGPTHKEGFIQLGSRYAHNAMGNIYAKFDGINFNVSGSGNAGIGIGADFTNSLTQINGQDYLLLSSDGNINGIMLDIDTYQDNGNIEQLGTGEQEIGTAATQATFGLPFDTNTHNSSALAISGNLLIALEGATLPWSTVLPTLSNAAYSGNFYGFDIINPMSPDNHMAETIDAKSYDIGDDKPFPVGSAIADADMVGNWIYVVNNTQIGLVDTDIIGNDVYNQTNFQIVDATSPVQFNAVGNINEVWATPYLDGAYRVKVIGNRAIVATNHLRDWGNPVDNAADSQYNEWGNLVSVDISDPQNPSISAVHTGERSHHLDLDITSNFAVTLTIEMGTALGNQHTGYDVRVQAFGLEERTDVYLNIINPTPYATLATQDGAGAYTYDPMSVSLFPPPSDNVGYSAHNDLTEFNKFGAIVASGDNIFAVYKNFVHTFKINGNTATIDPVDVTDYDTDIDMRAMDVEIMGTSLYILCASGSPGFAHSPDNTHIVKFDISDVSNPVLVSKTDIGEPSSTKLVVSGNTIYVNKTNGAGSSGIIPIEIDGIKSNAANIGSIKTSTLSVTDHIEIEGTLHIGQGGINTNGHISAQSLSSANDVHIKGGNRLRLYTDDSSNYSSISYPTGASNIYYAMPSTAPVNGQVLTSTAAGVLSWDTLTPGWTDSGTVVHLTDVGDQVGIGILAPDFGSKLHIWDSNGLNRPLLVIDNASTSTAANASIKFTRSSVSNTFTIGIDGSDNNFKINTGSVLSNLPEFTIRESNGFIGIMDPTPSYNLDINGTLRASDDTYLATSTGAQLTVGTTLPAISTNNRGLYVYGKSNIGHNVSVNELEAVSLGYQGYISVGSSGAGTHKKKFIKIKGQYGGSNSNLTLGVARGGGSDGYPLWIMDHDNYGSEWYFNMANCGSTGVADALDGRYIFGVGGNGNVFTGHGPDSGAGPGETFDHFPFTLGGGINITRNLRVRQSTRIDGDLRVIGTADFIDITNFNNNTNFVHSDNSDYNIGISNGGGSAKCIRINGGSQNNASATWIFASHHAGYTSPDYFIVRGNGEVDADNFNNLSDVRTKTNIEEVEYDPNIIRNLRPVIYNKIKDITTYGENAPVNAGFIAQEVEPIIPVVVKTTNHPDYEEEGYDGLLDIKHISYTSIIPYLVSELKGKDAIITDLETRLAAIESHLGL
jgi:hypothetical protein